MPIFSVEVTGWSTLKGKWSADKEQTTFQIQVYLFYITRVFQTYKKISISIRLMKTWHIIMWNLIYRSCNFTPCSKSQNTIFTRLSTISKYLSQYTYWVVWTEWELWLAAWSHVNTRRQRSFFNIQREEREANIIFILVIK